MKKQTLIIIIFILNISSAFAAVYKLSPEKGRVTFIAKGKPALITIKGEGQGAEAEIFEKNFLLNGTFSFQLSSLKTGIDLRDDHLKNQYLEIDKFPTAKLTLSNMEIPNDLTTDFRFTGILKLHGIEQSIEGRAKISNELNSLKLKADFSIKLSQFKIEIPNFKGVTVAEDIQVSLESPFMKEN